MLSKIMSAEQAVALIQDNDTVIISSSGGGVNEPTKLLAALEQRFLSTGHPANLVACHPCGLGDGKGGGTDRFAHPGMVRRVINQAYTRFFADYALTPVLPIDTTALDIVRRPEDLALIVQRVKSALGQGTHQRSLLDAPPEAAPASTAAIFDGQAHGLPDLQLWHRAFDREKGFSTDLFFNFLCLQEEMGELADELTHIWARREALSRDGMAAARALETAIDRRKLSITISRRTFFSISLCMVSDNCVGPLSLCMMRNIG